MPKRKGSRKRRKPVGGHVGARGRWRTRALRSALVLALLGIGAAGLLWTRCGVMGCPDPGELVSYRAGGAPILLDRNGAELVSLHPLERDVVPLDALPEHLPRAFVSVEDRRFHAHPGVDWIRVLGAALHNLRSPDERHGASTITMQLARTVFPDRLPRTQRTFRRKLLETRVALSIEREFSKAAILELYLNHVYFGAGTYGIEAASRYYFGRPAADLDLAEAALLAAMVQAPARTDPRRAPDRALSRRNLVLSLMESQGVVSAAHAEDARAQPLGVSVEAPPPESPGPAPYFVEAVRLQLEEVLGGGAYTAGLRVHTTLDPSAQAATEEAVDERIRRIESGEFGNYRGPRFDPTVPGGAAGTDYLQAAAVVMDVASGDVLALVGGRNFAHSRFDRAIRGRRPVGSAFKPFVVLAALREGFLPSQPVEDRPFRLLQEGSPAWAPENYDRAYRGPVGLREVLVRSLNIPTARLALATGMDAIVQAARDVGIRDSIPATPALALGTVALSPLELTTAYVTLAAQGRRRPPRFIHRVEDARGRVLVDLETGPGEPEASSGNRPAAIPDDVLDPRLAFLVTDMLGEAVDRGTGTGVRSGGFSGPAAGKTGTTPDGADTWFVGYTPRHAAAIWIGHDRPRSIVPGASGGGLAAPVWGRIMARIEGESGGPGWVRPNGVVERTVDPRTGRTVTGGCQLAGRSPVPELFLEEAVPNPSCPDSPGFFSRIASTVRGWFGGRDEAGGGGGSEGSGSLQILDGREGMEALLGAEMVPLESP